MLCAVAFPIINTFSCRLALTICAQISSAARVMAFTQYAAHHMNQDVNTVEKTKNNDECEANS